jgi:membrane protein YqaA with SNARE-associated domain
MNELNEKLNENPKVRVSVWKLPFALGKRLYLWVVQWAERPRAQLALFLIAVAESSFFIVPPDVLLLAMGVGKPKLALRFAAITLAGSVLGGVIGYGLGLGLWATLDQTFYRYIPGFTPEVFQQVANLYDENAFWAVFTAGFTPIPYKVFTVAAGVTQISFWPFLIASVFGRGLRFFLIGGLLYLFGKPIKYFIEKYFELLTITFALLLIGGFLLVKMVL